MVRSEYCLASASVMMVSKSRTSPLHTKCTTLENDLLKLHDKLLPLSSAYTQSGDGTGKVGRPALDLEEKSVKTIQNEESLDH
jgi:hypothetical protein